MVEDDIELLRQAISAVLDADDHIEISKILGGINVADPALGCWPQLRTWSG